MADGTLHVVASLAAKADKGDKTAAKKLAEAIDDNIQKQAAKAKRTKAGKQAKAKKAAGIGV